MGRQRTTTKLVTLLLAAIMIALGGRIGWRWWALCGVTRPAAGTGRIPTLTDLPRLPRVSWQYAWRDPGPEEKKTLLRDILEVKLGTYPAVSPPFQRAGKHRTMGFANFEPTEEDIKRLAAHYDAFYLTALSSHRIPVIRRYNPKARVLMCFAGSLTKEAKLHDAGSVDQENTDWILKNHRDWLLKDRDGRPVEGRSWSAKYWADPGHGEWQEFFAAKLNKALAVSGGPWDGVLLDEFLTGHLSTAAAWAGGGRVQTNYPTDKAWQEAQLAFLKHVAGHVSVPLVPNVEPVVLNPTSEGFNPEFFTEVQRIGGGAEAEIFVYHRADRGGFLGRDMVAVYLDRARRTPQGKMMFLNSATAATFGGNPDLTLFTYFTYLLVAGREREIYWTCKEGDSEIPHFWYREYDLDLGPPQEEMQTVGGVWRRDFANATVVVNPGRGPVVYSFDRECLDVRGNPLRSPITLETQTAMLLIRNRTILATMEPHAPPSAPAHLGTE